MLDDEAHPLTHKALIIRAASLRLQGKKDDSDVDLERARHLAPNDLDRIRNAALLMFEDGNVAGALETLYNPAAADDALLLALRAELQVPSDVARAEIDLERALELAPGSPQSDQAFRASGGVALMLGQLDRCEGILASLEGAAAEDPRTPALRGRLEFAKGNDEEGEALYRKASETDTENAAFFLVELASKLSRADRATDAVAVFEELGADRIPEDAMQEYGLVLLQANALSKAQALVQNRLSLGRAPGWVYRLGVELALRQEDYDAAVAHLTTLRKEGL